MNKRTGTIVAFTFAALGALTSAASARTLHASLGTSAQGVARDTFIADVDAVRLANQGAGQAANWIVPIPVDIPNLKALTIRGSLGASGNITCIAVASAPNGTLTSSGFVTLPPGGTAVANLNVPAGNFASLLCNIAGTARLLGVDYAP